MSRFTRIVPTLLLLLWVSTPTCVIGFFRGGSGGRWAAPTPSPTEQNRGYNAIFAVESSPELQVLACDETSVEVQGSQAGTLTADTFFIYLQGGDVNCTACSPLFRYVESVQPSTNGAVILSTRFTNAEEVLGESAGSGIEALPLEPLAGCSHSGATALSSGADEAPSFSSLGGECDKGPCQDFEEFAPQSVPGECALTWLQTNADGRCSYTNCFVGTDGDPSDCFSCKTECDNGCGASGSLLSFDGDFGLFDFGPACCNHDYCWSSTLTKSQCDIDFYDQMTAQCTPLDSALDVIILPLKVPQCQILAAAFFLAVHSTSTAADAYKQAQDVQKEYEKQPGCIAQCPSTQESGGQGTTVLTIDLLVTSGTFPVSYEMYQIPDQLYIEYEGQRIFDTGDLVSGPGSADVEFAGDTSIIQVTINAPESGTLWDVFVGCPYSPSP